MSGKVASSYDAFASFYDVFTADDDYDAWFRVIEEAECRHAAHVATSAWDIGTGTGKIIERLADRGLRAIGTDVSSRMLEQAQLRLEDSGCEFKISDIRKESICEQVDLVTAIDDVFNYMRSEEELRSAFKNVKEALSGDGLLIFDLNTRKTYETFFSEINVKVLGSGEGVIVSRPTDASKETSRDYALLIEGFFKEEGAWVSRSTLQIQRYFFPSEVEHLLESEGFALCQCYALSQNGLLVSDPDEEKYGKFIYVVRNSDDGSAV